MHHQIKTKTLLETQTWWLVVLYSTVDSHISRFTCGNVDLQRHWSGPLRAPLALSFTQIHPAVPLTDL